MNTSLGSMDSGGDKRIPETTLVPTFGQNLTTMQNIQSIQTVQQTAQSTLQSIQPSQAVVGSSTGLVGKSVSVELNQKAPIMKTVIPSGSTSPAEGNKLQLGSTLRLITSGILNNVGQSQPQTQPVSTIPPTYHVPRGPAAVANISAPRSTVATPIVRANTGQSVPTTRAGISTTISNPQWQPKTTSVVYAQQPPRHPTPSISRVSTRPPQQPTVQYAGQQQSRLIASTTTQGRTIQATMVTGVPGSPSRLLTPVLQTNNNSITRIPVTQNKPLTPQVVTSSTVSTPQPARTPSQNIQLAQPNRPLATATGPINRITTPAPGTGNRLIGNTTSITVQPTVCRQVSLNQATAGPSTATVGRIVIPPQHPQQPQPQQPQQQPQPSSTPRVVQTVTCLSNINTVTRIITTTTNTSNVSRIPQPIPPGAVTKIAGMPFHTMPITSVRVTPGATPTVKTPSNQNISQTAVQIKQPPSGQSQATGLRISTPSANNNSVVVSGGQSVQGQYLQPPHTTTYYSFETAGTYSQYRQTAVQPVRLLVESNYEEPIGKPNASPRPSILRKRDHDTSPIKGAAKNLVPVLASLSATPSSPPCSPRGDLDGVGCQSSGSTTVSATSSPGLDEEPDQSRIIVNTIAEMSPRKKPRKQQLTGVELTEPRCTEEEMQFINEDKMKREIREETKDKTNDKRQMSNVSHDVKCLNPSTLTIRTRPVPSLLASSWKNRWSGRLHHYKRPGDVRPREERRPTVAELAQQKHVLQKLNGWKVYHLTAQMEDIADLEKQVHEKLKTTLTMLESQQQQPSKGRQDDGLERVNELIKGNMQRSSLISEGMNEARTQLVTIFQHKGPITDLLQRCGNKRAQKKRDK